MEKEVLVKVEGLSKKFCKDLKTSLWFGIQDVFSFSNKKVDNALLRTKEFWAIKDINFEIRRGECLGLIGHNGAGKSTLLKILNGLINPDIGKVTIRGRVGALIELGAGFNPILSGRENIYNNGAVLGFSKKEIDEKIEEIIDFSEIREFIDMPVQNYSSGMKVRLGFAIAAQMKPDVLLIDEVLAVGDLGFVLKCFKTIDTLLPTTAVIFVSHSMPMVARICNQIVLMDHGQQEYLGNNVGKGIDLYFSKFTQNKTNIVFSNSTLKLVSARIEKAQGETNEIKRITWNEDLALYFKFNVLAQFNSGIEFIIIIVDKEQRPIASLNPNPKEFNLNMNNESFEFSVSHKNIQLSKGIYAINLAIRDRKSREPILRINDVMSFQIIHKEEIWEPFLLNSDYKQIDNDD